MKPLAQEPRFVAMLQWGWGDLGVAHSQKEGNTGTYMHKAIAGTSFQDRHATLRN